MHASLQMSTYATTATRTFLVLVGWGGGLRQSSMKIPSIILSNESLQEFEVRLFHHNARKMALLRNEKTKLLLCLKNF